MCREVRYVHCVCVNFCSGGADVTVRNKSLHSFFLYSRMCQMVFCTTEATVQRRVASTDRTMMNQQKALHTMVPG